MITVDEGRAHATITAAAVMDAGELDRFIAELAQARSQMIPCIPEDVLHRADMHDAGALQRCTFQLRVDADGRCTLVTRNPGLGWMTSDVSMSALIALQDLIMIAVGNGPLSAMSVGYDADSGTVKRRCERLRGFVQHAR